MSCRDILLNTNSREIPIENKASSVSSCKHGREYETRLLTLLFEAGVWWDDAMMIATLHHRQNTRHSHSHNTLTTLLSTQHRNRVQQFDMPDPSKEYTTTQPPTSTYPKDASRNNTNGTDADVLERMKIREICEGWGNAAAFLILT
jgi:hypothetical protein